MKRIFALCLMAACLSAPARNVRVSCDESCRAEFLKDAPAPQGPVYPVVSPAGRSAVEMIAQAPRLSTLDGKVIAVVGGSFMAGITHPEIKRLITENYPTAKVLLFDEIGSCGPYPAPGVKRKKAAGFEQKLKELQVDAVISGNGGCGLCTPKEVGACIAAERMGIPSVMIAGPGFDDQAVCTARCNGIPVLRVARYPGAFASHSEKELKDNTREILWPRIVEALTRPLTDEEKTISESKGTGDIRDDVFVGTYDEISEYFRSQNWSDGLPIVPPTFEKVSEFLKYTPHTWDEELAVLPPANRSVSVWHVAVNGVMSGCKPEYMPVLVALAKGLGDGNFRRTLSSTHAWMPYCWINGPIAVQLGIDCGQGQINEDANVAIGRFLNLALMNLCGYYVKQDRMGTFGYPMPWCLAEDEDACERVGWAPYHVRNGFSAGESVITLGSALLWGNNMAPSTTDPEKVMELLAWDISERGQFALGSGRQYTFRTILMTEPVAKILAKKYKSPEDLEKDLIRESRRPLKERAYANYYANPGSRKDGAGHSLQQHSAYTGKTEGAASTKTPEWYDSEAAAITTVPVMKAGMTAFIITGDSARSKVQTMPGGGYVSIKIDLPDNWDELF